MICNTNVSIDLLVILTERSTNSIQSVAEVKSICFYSAFQVISLELSVLYIKSMPQLETGSLIPEPVL